MFDNEDIFEAAAEITAAAVEGNSVTIDAAGGKNAAPLKVDEI